MRFAPALACLLLVAACAQTPDPAPRAEADASAAQAAGERSAAKARRVCREEGAATGSRTSSRRICTTVREPASAGAGS